MERDIIQILQQDIGKFTKSQRKVADYIIKNPMDAAFSTIDKLAHQVHTSTTTIVRLALLLGFSGYTEFQKELQDFLKSRTSPSTKLAVSFQERGEKNDIIKKIASQEMENISKTFDRLSDDLILQTVEFLQSAKRIYVVGSRSCFSVAHYLNYNLMRVFGNCTLLSNFGVEICEQINLIGEQDVLLAITMPRYIRNVVSITQIAKEKNATVIAITDGHLSPVARYANILLAVECKTTGFNNSIISAMLVAQMLIGASTIKNLKQVQLNLHNTEDVLRRMGIHYDSSY